MRLNQLPDDVDALKKLVANQSVLNEQLQSKVTLLQEQLNLALAKRYAASSEKISPDQIHLFNEAEVDASVLVPEPPYRHTPAASGDVSPYRTHCPA